MEVRAPHYTFPHPSDATSEQCPAHHNSRRTHLASNRDLVATSLLGEVDVASGVALAGEVDHALLSATVGSARGLGKTRRLTRVVSSQA